MYVDLTPDGGLEAIDQIGQWLLDYGRISGRLHAQLAAVKIIARFGEGTYEIKNKGKLYKGTECVVHRDDIKEFVMGKEVELKKGKEPKEVKEVKEDKAPSTGGAPDRRRARKKSNPWAK
jgi:hypothetical protein